MNFEELITIFKKKKNLSQLLKYVCYKKIKSVREEFRARKRIQPWYVNAQKCTINLALYFTAAEAKKKKKRISNVQDVKN